MRSDIPEDYRAFTPHEQPREKIPIIPDEPIDDWGFPQYDRREQYEEYFIERFKPEQLRR